MPRRHRPRRRQQSASTSARDNVRLLLDTHIALWAVVNSPRLSRAARELILSPENRLWVSAASVWEITIKHALGRGDMPVSGARANALFALSGYASLAVDAQHAASVSLLPQQGAHADPFDRMLIAQARAESMTLLTHDAEVAAYGDGVMRV